jgi:hypothetical protein
MVRRRNHGQEPSDSDNGPQDEQRPTEARESPRNGASEQPAAQQHDGQEGAQGASPTVRRAEEMVDRMAERVGHYASVLGHKVLWLAARAREEAEDIWAEAQAVRRGEHRP